MGKTHLKNSQQNRSDEAKRPTTHVGQEKPKTGSVLQRRFPSKTEITLNPAQRREAAWLFKQYDRPKPRWLRKKFLIDKYRRKKLNNVLCLAGLDGYACGTPCANEDWSGEVHTLWHKINGKPLCK